MLEMEVRARPWYIESSFPRKRDVYLRHRDPKEPAARMPFLMHVECPVGTVAEIIAWAESLAIPVVYEPAGNMAPDWKWPVVAPEPKPVPVTSSF